MQTRSWETQSGGTRTTTAVIPDSVWPHGIANAAAREAVQADGAVRSAPAASAAPEPSYNQDAQDDPAAAVPEVSYTTEIKAEDIPF